MKKIQLSTKTLKLLLREAQMQQASGDSDMGAIAEDIHDELCRREFVAQIEAELKTGRGYYGHRPDYARQELEATTKRLYTFKRATFDWIVDELDSAYSASN